MPTCATFLRDKEYQVTFAQVAAGYPVAFFQLAVRAARQAYAVGFLIELGYQAGAVRSMFAVATGTVGSAYPLGGIEVQLVVVCQYDIHAQAYRGLCQCFIVETGSGGMAGT